MKLKNEVEFIERRIITGLIISADFHQRINRMWNPLLIESPELRTVATWCIDYYDKYQTAPDSNIQSIYMEQLKIGKLSNADAVYIEELLTGLSDEYGRDTQFNSAYLYDQTIQYFKAQELELHNQRVQELINAGQVEEAEKLIHSYTPTVLDEKDTGVDLSTEEALERVERAFNETQQGVISYPGALGEMWNAHLIRGGFFTLLAPEKRGKSFLLMEMALRAIRQRANVAFFESGDMTESQILRRICAYISRKSNKGQYEERYKPVGDCISNQIDTCDRPDRNCDYGVFDDVSDENVFMRQRNEYESLPTLKSKYEEHPDYTPCKSHSCNVRKGTVWLTKVKGANRLTAKVAKKELQNFFSRYKRRFKLACYPAGFLTVSEIRQCLNNWERYDGFVPDVIVIDYADLLSASDGETNEFRHRQDHVWKNLRALSQEKHVLLLTATQADADSYKKGKLSISNFSEDKRKLAHVTAQYGMNQDLDGREKKLGILRINEIVVREGAFSADNEVCVLQDLEVCRPFLESYFASK